MSASKPLCAVVGVGPQLGFSIAKLFSAHGYSVALLARNQSNIDQLAHRIQQAGGVAAAFSSDAANERSIEESYARMKAQLGSPEVLVYNAAILKPGLPSATSFDRLVDDFKVNVAGANKWAHLCSPAMKERGKGSIILTGGILSKMPMKQYASLSLGKAGLLNLSSSLAQELGPQGIHVASVTINGFIKPNSLFDPEEIAKAYWTLHTQPKDKWQLEYEFKGAKKSA
ncbi:short-chain dehydrogenase/reductase SDR [Gonapodya prolifera JEL478]|uniref:Short-chain dehydrogenase/reductase SDR n=1 Tax=Gonapodya prolifera (strain JEL478) TaxID=1344416 RepID=A0A139A8P4_GONPJ|nr:short-chain dehydrogenase/reductase SDR [Gonapodya prolifera JEL478]|eukprot:KXS12825.1 short-chain dehydrogenase/reductase SDR [Gonapodya prolifera JEL478]